MRKIKWAMVGAVVGFFVAAYAADPSVTVHSVAQRAGTKLVDISYSATDADGDDLTVTISVKDGESVVGTLSGTEGENQSVSWDAGAAWSGSVGLLQFVVSVSDGGSSGGSEGMVLIPAGTVSRDSDFGGGSLNNPSDFYMDATEVTKAQWDVVYNWAVVNGYSFNKPGSGKASDHPVQTVTWYDCVRWCNARSEKEGKTPCYNLNDWSCDVSANGYRLPTSDEWEYAARGGSSGKRFPWGDTVTHSQANYYSYSGYSYDTSSTRGYHPDYDEGGTPYTSPSGTFAPNGYGLYDMAGNVWEWCNTSSGSARGIRGGGCYYDAGNLRCGYENWRSPDDAHSTLGFRAVSR